MGYPVHVQEMIVLGSVMKQWRPKMRLPSGRAIERRPSDEPAWVSFVGVVFPTTGLVDNSNNEAIVGINPIQLYPPVRLSTIGQTECASQLQIFSSVLRNRPGLLPWLAYLASEESRRPTEKSVYAVRAIPNLQRNTYKWLYKDLLTMSSPMRRQCN